uniref:Putative HTH-type transcriptional regulator yybE n=1 Tax=Lygus hesperus TaxID=30085 RepID=A0A0A9YFU0_LYGHE
MNNIWEQVGQYSTNVISKYTKLVPNLTHTLQQQYPQVHMLIDVLHRNWLLLSFIILSTVGYIYLCIISILHENTATTPADTSGTCEAPTHSKDTLSAAVVSKDENRVRKSRSRKHV